MTAPLARSRSRVERVGELPARSWQATARLSGRARDASCIGPETTYRTDRWIEAYAASIIAVAICGQTRQ